MSKSASKNPRKLVISNAQPRSMIKLEITRPCPHVTSPSFHRFAAICLATHIDPYSLHRFSSWKPPGENCENQGSRVWKIRTKMRRCLAWSVVYLLVVTFRDGPPTLQLLLAISSSSLATVFREN